MGCNGVRSMTMVITPIPEFTTDFGGTGLGCPLVLPRLCQGRRLVPQNPYQQT